MASEKKKKKSIIKKIVELKKTILMLILIFALSGFLISVAVYYKYKSEIPSINTVSDYKPDAGTKVYSYDGELIAEFYHENRRIIVPYDKIPEKLRLAFVAGEDSSF
ncbi:MAG TPA: penicillin-binding protein, partial [bacterium]|nr:penicillin-binding protein [bacterium]